MTSSGGGTSALLPVGIQLPVEVWQQIAGHMSSRCWARVSRTCRAMHSVQPKQVDISVGSKSALAWVQTHWGQASSLKLTWMQRDIQWVMAHNAASVTSLKRLQLSLLQERSPSTAMLLTWLLAQASQLQLLFLEHPRPLAVPPIRNLSHLLLASTEFARATGASIRQLRSLQTLWLGRLQPNLEVTCAEVDLASLPQLSDVCVDNLPLPRIALPRHCRLHLVGNDNIMDLGVWCDIARYGQLHSINRQSKGLVVDGNMPLSLLCSKCSVLYWWDIKEFGHPCDPTVFTAARFSCLTHLNLQGREIHIDLPQKLPLQVLHVHARSLSVVCVNPQEHANRLQQLMVTYCTLRGADIFVLVPLMCNLGAMVSKVEVPEAVDEQEDYHGFLVSSWHVPEVWKCPCGACLDCLHKI